MGSMIGVNYSKKRPPIKSDLDFNFINFVDCIYMYIIPDSIELEHSIIHNIFRFYQQPALHEFLVE